ncbi:MAG: type II toxin-antitoxin system VapC family toxin [Terriglobales bacterium]
MQTAPSAPSAYWDTSALAKVYLQEKGSATVRAWAGRFSCTSSGLLTVELRSLLSRRRAAGDLSEREWISARKRVARDRAGWALIPVAELVLERAGGLADSQRVRALDAIHLATAALLQERLGVPVPFLTADRRQAEAAAALGLEVRLVPA